MIRSGPRGSLCGRGGIQLEIGDLCWPVRRDFAVWYREDTMAWESSRLYEAPYVFWTITLWLFNIAMV